MKKHLLSLIILWLAFQVSLPAQHSKSQFMHNSESEMNSKNSWSVNARHVFLSMDDFFSRLTANKDQSGRSYFLQVNGGASQIINDRLNLNNAWQTENKPGFQLHAGINRRLKPLLSVSFGAGISRYSGGLVLAEEFSKPTIYGLVDNSTSKPDTAVRYRTYNAEFTYTSIQQNNSITFFDIPMFIELGNANINTMGFFLKAGVNASVPLFHSFSGTGDYIQNIHYTAYNLEIENASSLYPGLLKFDDDLESTMGNYKLNPLYFSFNFSGGITFPLARDFIIRLGPSFHMGGINSLSQESENVDRFWKNYSHLLETPASKSFTRMFGFEIGIQYVRNIYF